MSTKFDHASYLERKEQNQDGYRDGKKGIPAQPHHRADLYDKVYPEAYAAGYSAGVKSREYLVSKYGPDNAMWPGHG